MDEKTAQLRDLFVDVAGEETVTETQEETPGSLIADEGSVDERLRSVVTGMREALAFRTSLDDDRLCQLVRAFYAGDDDETIAATLDCEPATVFRARMDLHLVRDRDLPGELESRLRAASDGERPATDRDRDEQTIERAREAIEAMDRSRRVSHRYRTAFEEVLTDADLSVQFTAGAHEDGLDDATDGAEVGVEL